MLFTKLPLRLEASTAAWLAAFFGSFCFFFFVLFLNFLLPAGWWQGRVPWKSGSAEGRRWGAGGQKDISNNRSHRAFP